MGAAVMRTNAQRMTLINNRRRIYGALQSAARQQQQHEQKPIWTMPVPFKPQQEK